MNNIQKNNLDEKLTKLKNKILAKEHKIISCKREIKKLKEKIDNPPPTIKIISNIPSKDEKISIIFPTRGRINNIDRIWESILNTISQVNNFEVCIYIDDDDIQVIQHMKEKYINELRIKYVIGERITMTRMWNEAYKHLATGNIIMFCGDDIVFRTKNWDTEVRNAFDKYSDKIALVFGDDGWHGSPSNPFIHRKWIDVSGFALPPYFSCDYSDSWLNEVARALKRKIYLKHVLTEHMHFINGKAEKDQTTLDRLKRGKADNVSKIYKNTENERIRHIEKLRDYINSFVS
tara:strand:+ start:537 stop:1409 length:873 start_codon:yes stop_codon:yes gene_type:complete